MKISKKILISFLLLAFLFSGCGCKKVPPKKVSLGLEIWGTLDSADALEQIFANYRKVNPNITGITYKKIAADTYRRELIDGLASGNGPDIFLIHNTWLTSFKDKITEAPQIQGSGIINEQKFNTNFVDVAATDFVEGGKIYAVPLKADSLGLYYNKDLFNQAGITSPPKNWNEFIEDVQKLTKTNDFNEIIQAGAAIGTVKNINRSTDILNLLMLQNGTKMTDDNGRPSFDSSVSIGGKNVFPGEEALDFYTQFASTGQYYTWNNRMHYSLDAFAEGRVAMMFNYSWQRAAIAEKAPKLNYDVAPIPQFENSPRVNYANYWAFAVSKNKIPKSDPYNNTPAANVTNEERVAQAWLFLTYLTTKPDNTFLSVKGTTEEGRATGAEFDPARHYLIKSGEPAARRDLLEEQKTDPKIGVFASDNLIAKSWRRTDPESVEAIFAEMIEKVNSGQSTVSDAVRTAARRVQVLSGN